MGGGQSAFPWNPLASIAPDYAWPIERQIEVMDRYGIDYGVLVQVSMYSWDNRYVLDCARRYPGRFQLVGLVNPESDQVEEEMTMLANQGIKGLRLGPMLRPDIEWFNTKRADRVWYIAGELGLILTLLVIPEQIPAARRAIQRFPSTRILVDHLARPDQAAAPNLTRELLSLSDFEQVAIKLSALGFISRMPYPHQDILELIRDVYDYFGADRMVWGTDTPMSQIPEGIPRALDMIDLALPDLPPQDRELDHRQDSVSAIWVVNRGGIT